MINNDRNNVTADDIFSGMSAPMPAAVKAAIQVVRGEAPDDELRHTEAALAAAFAVELGDGLRYDHRRRRWMSFEHGVWREDQMGAALRLLQSWAESRVFEQVAAATSKRDMAAVAAATRRALAVRTLKAILELAAVQAAMADAGDAWDVDPWRLVSLDGTAIDLRTGAARPAIPADRVTLAAGVRYDPEATCPVFRVFLAAVCDDDPALMRLVQILIGYTLTGVTTEQVFIVLTGVGSNGKSTLLEIMAYVLGDLAAVLPFAVLARDRDVRSVPVEIARLPGRRFVRASEIRGGAALDEGRVKSITGEDTLIARGLYQSPFEFRSVAKLWLAVNKLPRVDDRGHAFWRRAIVVPFRRTFDGATRDNELMAKLKAEGPGILNWAIEGALLWQRDGLPRDVGAVVEARDTWRESQDLVAQWAATALVAHPDGRLPAAEAYRAFAAWASAEGLTERERPGRRSFGEWMADKFVRKATKTGNAYLAMLVEGERLEADPGNPLMRAQGESSPNTLNTLNPPPSGGHRV